MPYLVFLLAHKLLLLFNRVQTADDEIDASLLSNQNPANHYLLNQSSGHSSTSSSPQHSTNTLHDESDSTPPPMSSIDDLISSSPEGSLSSPRGQ